MTELTKFCVREIKPFVHPHGVVAEFVHPEFIHPFQDLLHAWLLDRRFGMRANGSRCLGAYALDEFALENELPDCSDQLLGIIEYGPLTTYDRLSSASRFERLGLRAVAMLGRNNLGNRVLGIHSLTVDENLEESLASEVTEVLVQNAIYEAGGREVRVARYPDDPALILLRQQGFGLKSRPIEQVESLDVQQIYARPRSFGRVK